MKITVTKEALATLLDGIEYPCREIRQEWEKVAKACNLVIAYGASDDLLELAGIISDEFGAWEGTTEMIDDVAVKAEWCPNDHPDNPSWRITCTKPSAKFRIMEDREVYCEGVVFEHLPTAIVTTTGEGK